MEVYYLPVRSKNVPALIEINGHQVMVFSGDKADLEEHLDQFGASAIQEIKTDSPELMMKNFAEKSSAKVVFTPPELEVIDVIETLKADLPWLL